MSINSGDDLGTSQGAVKNSFWRYWLFTLLFSGICLSAVIFVYDNHRTDKLGYQVEKLGLGLLGYLEYDEKDKFYVSEENRADFEQYLNKVAGYHEGGVYTFVWDAAEKKVIWSPTDKPISLNPDMSEAMQRHVSQVLMDAGNDFSPATAVIVPARTSGYMTGAQVFRLLNKNEGQEYVLVVAGSMQAIEEDVFALRNTTITIFILLNVLLLVGWLLFWAFAKFKNKSSVGSFQTQ